MWTTKTAKVGKTGPFSTQTSMLDEFTKDFDWAFDGFDTHFGNLFKAATSPKYPFYDIIAGEEDGSKYAKINIALAGIPKEEIEIFTEGTKLKVRYACGTVNMKGNEKYVHQGIADRSFSKIFDIGTGKVESAEMDNGILRIMVKFPDPKKPEKSNLIPIK